MGGGKVGGLGMMDGLRVVGGLGVRVPEQPSKPPLASTLQSHGARVGLGNKRPSNCKMGHQASVSNDIPVRRPGAGSQDCVLWALKTLPFLASFCKIGHMQSVVVRSNYCNREIRLDGLMAPGISDQITLHSMSPTQGNSLETARRAPANASRRDLTTAREREHSCLVVMQLSFGRGVARGSERRSGALCVFLRGEPKGWHRRKCWDDDLSAALHAVKNRRAG